MQSRYADARRSVELQQPELNTGTSPGKFLIFTGVLGGTSGGGDFGFCAPLISETSGCVESAAVSR